MEHEVWTNDLAEAGALLRRGYTVTEPRIGDYRCRGRVTLTRRDADCLHHIEMLIARDGVSPTIREIARSMQMVAPSGVHRLVQRLERKGRIGRTPFEARGVFLLSGENAPRPSRVSESARAVGHPASAGDAGGLEAAAKDKRPTVGLGWFG